MKKIKNNIGITLIALVITIIILLILSAVSINIIAGENGILKKADTAKQQTLEANLSETNKLSDYNSYIETYTTRSASTSELEARILQLEQFAYTQVEANGWVAKKYNNGDLTTYTQVLVNNSVTAWGSNYLAEVSVPGDYPVAFTKIIDISTSFVCSQAGSAIAVSFPQGYASTTTKSESQFLTSFPNNLLLTRATSATLKGTAYIKVEGKWK